MSEIIGRKKINLLQNSEGEFFEAGCDSPDRWTIDPFRATPREGLLYLRDANFNGGVKGEIVEIELTACLTGLRQADLYRDGQSIESFRKEYYCEIDRGGDKPYFDGYNHSALSDDEAVVWFKNRHKDNLEIVYHEGNGKEYIIIYMK